MRFLKSKDSGRLISAHDLRQRQTQDARQIVLRRYLHFLLSLMMLAGTAFPAANAGDSSGERNKSQSNAGDNSLFDTYSKSFVQKYLSSGSYMTPAEIKPGMTGYGLSVFQGSKIEKFEITVIGVLKKAIAGRDAILVRMSGTEMQKNNVIRGMSGSPCYINGKIIGAVSFGYDFSKEPIAGVTPIIDMLDALAENHEGKIPIAKSGERGFSVPWQDSGLKNVSSGELRMSPLVSPVALVGFSPAAEKFLSSQFKDIGLHVSSGSAGGMASSELNVAAASQIKPGAAVGVLLSSGDFTTVATGTATARFGNKVLAFGHPFLSAGSVEFPLTTSVVHKVLPSLSVSFKLSSPLQEVGSFTADRPWSCGGVLGRAARMIPCTFDVVDETRKIERKFNSKIIDHPDLTPQLLAATTMSAVDSTHQYAGPYVAKVESRLEADGIDPLERNDCFASNIAPHSLLEMLMGIMSGNSVAGSVMRNASSVANNEFQKASIKSFKIKVTLQDGHQTATIDRVYVDKSYAAPGEQVKVLCLIKPYNQEQRVETLSFQIPRDAADGNLVIGVAGGDQIDYIRRRLGISDPEPQSLKQIVDDLRHEGRGDALNLVVALPEQTLLMDGVKIPDPPSHWSRVLFSNRHTRGPQIVKGELRAEKQTEWLLSGSHVITVEVRNPDRAAARTPASSMPSYSGGEDPAMTELARKSLGSSSMAKNSGRSQPGVTIIQGGIAATATIVQQGSSAPVSSAGSKAPVASGSIFSSAGKLYPHMRLQQIWRQETEEDFHAGKTDGTTVDSWGRVGPGLEDIASKPISPESTIWSAVFCNGSFYYSAGNEVWRWKGDDSSPEKVAKLEAAIIPSLAADSAGNIYAAAVPGGGVYAIANGGSPRQIFKPEEPVVTALCCDDNDNLYVGTAGKGKVYRLDKSCKESLLFDTEQAHVTALFYSRAQRRLYIGTAEKGAVYEIDENGKSKAVFQSPDHIVTGVAKTRNGDLYLSTANQGSLVRVLDSGEAQALASSDAFYTLFYDADHDAVFSGDAEGDITLAARDPITEQPYFLPVCHTDQEAVLALASSGKSLFSGSSNLAVLKSFNLTSAREPVYQSQVKDAGRVSNWVRLRTSGPFTERDREIATHVKVETRSGNTSLADSCWTSWTGAEYDGESFKILSPPGRFFQYRLSWKNIKDANDIKLIGPQIGRVDVVFIPGDSAPQFSTISLKAASAVSGKCKLSITGKDVDGDNMLCSIDISSDNGNTWEKLASDLRPKNARREFSARGSAPVLEGSSGSPAAPARERETAEQKDDREKNNSEAGRPEDGAKKNDSGTAKEKIPNSESEKKPQLPGEGRLWLQGDSFSASPAEAKESKDSDEGSGDEDGKKGDGSKKGVKNRGSRSSKESSGGSSGSSSGKASEGASTETFSHMWDSTKVKDGNYLLRFTLDDRLSNSEDHRHTINLRAVTVDNNPPEIELIDCKRKGDNKVECKVVVKDKMSPIVNAMFRIDEGDYFALTAEGNTSDGLSSTLVANDLPCATGGRRIEVKVSDRAGNTAIKSANIKQP